MKFRVVAEYGIPGCANEKVGAVLDAVDKLEAVKMFMEKLQETGEKYNIKILTIDDDVEYI